MVMIPMIAGCCSRKEHSICRAYYPSSSKKDLGEDYRKIFLVHFTWAVLLTFADIAARMLFNPYETPIGVFTAIIGIPFFISVLERREDNEEK